MLKNAPFLVVDDFLPEALAQAMRRDIDAHFAKPGAHRADTHQVWNYWFVPELYTYLRTTPEKVIAPIQVEKFVAALRQFAISQCGMSRVSWPYLSLYVSGCKQGVHNDSGNGRFGFVYSLTRNERLTAGGETVIYRDGNYFREKLASPAAGRGFYDLIAPRFNRLLIFDDRLPHAVERLEGSMDPVEGRFVLHGHLSEGGSIVTGALQAQPLAAALSAGLAETFRASAAVLNGRHGPLVLRIEILPGGEVAQCEVVTDRVVHADPADTADTAWRPWLERLPQLVRSLRFPAAAGPTQIIYPIIFGKPFAS